MAIAVIAIAAAVRVLASRNDLWLDEIWSLRLATSVKSPVEILLGLYLDNNHCLNTWFMHLLSGLGSDWVLRVPSLVASVATVVLAAMIGLRIRGRLGAVSALLLTGGSYILVHYGSEARGYSLAGFFALAAWYVVMRGLEDRRRAWPGLFWLVTTLGVLSHATFIAEAYAGILVWSVLRLVRVGGPRRTILAAILRWHAAPFLTLLAYYMVRLRFMVIGGGPPFSLQFVLGRLSAYTVGLPSGEARALLAALSALALLTTGLWLLRRQGCDRWVLYAGNCIVFPAALLLFRQPERLFERYFFLSAVFFVMLAVESFAAGLSRRGAWRAISLVLAVMFLFGNAVHIARLVRFGRGQYSAALTYIAEHGTPVAGKIDVSSDNDFRNGMLVEHFGQRLAADRRVVYRNSADLSGAAVEWMIMHTRDAPYPPETVVAAGEHGSYRFERAYPSAPMSGFYWNLFRLSSSVEKPLPPD